MGGRLRAEPRNSVEALGIWPVSQVLTSTRSSVVLPSEINFPNLQTGPGGPGGTRLTGASGDDPVRATSGGLLD